MESADGILQDNIYGDVYYRHGDYVLPDSDSCYYCYQDIQLMTEEELCVARNEILARHGWIFDDGDLREYFYSKAWYVPSIPGREFDYSSLSQTGQDNIDLLHEIEMEAAKNADKIYRSQGDMPDLSKLDTEMGHSASCEAFTVKLPNYWKDYAVVTYEANRISFYERISREAVMAAL